MERPVTVVVGFLTSLVALGFAMYLVVRDGDDEGGLGSRGVEERLDGILARLESLEATQAETQRRVAGLGGTDAAPAPDRAAIEAVVRSVLAERASEPRPAAAVETVDEAAEDLEDALRRLRDPNLSVSDRMALLGKLAKLGGIDRAIADMKRRADQAATDPQAHVDLGMAYIAKLREGQVSQMEIGKLATFADQAYDRALALDDTHWDARFQKAVALSFWPPVMGKQPEAIRHFETLISQQRNASPRPEHAQTHLLLGNLYLQSGQRDRALEVWNSGLEVFPDDAGLAERIAALGGN